MGRASEPDTGLDFYDAATIRCIGGASMIVSGAGTAPNHGRLGNFWVQVYGSSGVLEFANGHGFASDHRAASLVLRRHSGDVLELTAAELGGRATSALAPPSAHADGATATQSLRAFVAVCRGEAPFLGARADVGVQVTSVIHAMHESAWTSQLVDAR
jgi:hypothetical protein